MLSASVNAESLNAAFIPKTLSRSALLMAIGLLNGTSGLSAFLPGQIQGIIILHKNVLPVRLVQCGS